VRPVLLCIIGEHILLLGLQVLHPRGAVRDLGEADRGPGLGKDDRLRGVIDDDMARHGLLGDELEGAVLKILVGDGAMVEQGDVRICGPGLLECRKDQRDEGQSAGPSGARDGGRSVGVIAAAREWRKATARRQPEAVEDPCERHTKAPHVAASAEAAERTGCA
jgi:hypothetical protein